MLRIEPLFDSSVTPFVLHMLMRSLILFIWARPFTEILFLPVMLLIVVSTFFFFSVGRSSSLFSIWSLESANRNWLKLDLCLTRHKLAFGWLKCEARFISKLCLILKDYSLAWLWKNFSLVNFKLLDLLYRFRLKLFLSRDAEIWGILPDPKSSEEAFEMRSSSMSDARSMLGDIGFAVRVPIILATLTFLSLGS